MTDKTEIAMKRRIRYILATIILLFIEVMIALFAHDHFIRPYVGDILVVVVLYTFVRIWIPERWKLLPLYVFSFAVLVEILQFFHIVNVIGLSNNRFISILIGGTFDWKDIVCYGVGCMILALYEIFINRLEEK